jgi:hypothetical protein
VGIIVKKEIFWVVLFLLFSAIVFCLYTFTSTGILDPGDGLMHYQISRFSWKHPELFFNHWGKPLYTLLSSPFSQFGFKGLMIFNIILALLTGIFTYKSARIMNLHLSPLAIIFVLFTPVYFNVVLAGLTEVLFAFLLILSIYFFLKENYSCGTIVLSFMPFARSEAQFILPLFAILLIYRKQYKIIPLFLTGFIIYGIAGYFHYGSFFWYFTENPYTGASEIYGHGDLFHFVNSYKAIIGNPLLFVFIPAVLYLIMSFFIKEKILFMPEIILLLFGSFVSCLAVHSFLWWKGLYGSLGLIRVMAMVAPPFILVCMFGFSWFKKLPVKLNWLQYIFAVVFIYLVVKEPIRKLQFPISIEYDLRDRLVNKAAEWYKTNNFEGRKIFYLHPMLGYLLDVDPYDSAQATLLWGISDTEPQKDIPKGSVVFWDGHFSPNEGRKPLSVFMENPSFKLIASFKPEQEIIVLGGYRFEIYVFEKISD